MLDPVRRRAMLSGVQSQRHLGRAVLRVPLAQAGPCWRSKPRQQGPAGSRAVGTIAPSLRLQMGLSVTRRLWLARRASWPERHLFGFTGVPEPELSASGSCLLASGGRAVERQLDLPCGAALRCSDSAPCWG